MLLPDFCIWSWMKLFVKTKLGRTKMCHKQFLVWIFWTVLWLNVVSLYEWITCATSCFENERKYMTKSGQCSLAVNAGFDAGCVPCLHLYAAAISLFTELHWMYCCLWLSAGVLAVECQWLHTQRNLISFSVSAAIINSCFDNHCAPLMTARMPLPHKNVWIVCSKSSL